METRGPQAGDPKAPVLRQTSGTGGQHWARDRASAVPEALGRAGSQAPPSGTCWASEVLGCPAAGLPGEADPNSAPVQSRAGQQESAVEPAAVAWGRGQQPLPSIPETLAGNRGWAAALGPGTEGLCPRQLPADLKWGRSRPGPGRERPCLRASGWRPLGEGSLLIPNSRRVWQSGQGAAPASGRPDTLPAGSDQVGPPRPPWPCFPDRPGTLPAAGPRLAPALLPPSPSRSGRKQKDPLQPGEVHRPGMFALGGA